MIINNSNQVYLSIWALGTLAQWNQTVTNIVKLDLRDNQLSGEIPHEIGDLTLLSEIGLSGNPELITPYEVKPKGLVTKAMQKALDAHMYMDQGSNDDKLTQQEKEGKKLDVDNPDAVVAYYGEVLRNERDNGPSRLCIVS